MAQPGDEVIILRGDYSREGLMRRLQSALTVAFNHGGTDESHHLHWVVDRMVRALTRFEYPAWVKKRKAGDEGPDTYDWDEGIAP
jgi:hypothetical protein